MRRPPSPHRRAKPYRPRLLASIGVVLLVAHAAAAQRFTPALDLSPAANQVPLLRDDLARGPEALPEAQRRLAALGERTDNYFITRDAKPGEAGGKPGEAGGKPGEAGGKPGEPGQVLLSLPAFLVSLPRDQLAALAAPGDPALRREMESLRSRTSPQPADPADFVTLALRNAQSSVMPELLAEASARLRRRDDLVGAADVLRLADSRLAAKQSYPPPSLPLLNTYWWFDRKPDRLGGIRAYPVRVGSSAFLASPTHVVSLRVPSSGEGGLALLWTSPEVPKKDPGETIDEWEAGRLDFPSFEPAVLTDAEGTPRIVIARHLGVEGGYLRACRASDGAALWSTSAADASASSRPPLNFCSSPTVVGRYVYVLATRGADTNGRAGIDRNATLELVALESTTGKVLFRTALGGLSQVPPPRRGRRAGKPADITRTPALWDEQTPPRVVGPFLYVHAGGAIFQLDRFTGSPLRATTYPTCAELAKEGSDPASQPASRWTTTPLLVAEVGPAEQAAAPILIFAPRDTEDVFALDALTLRTLWSIPRLGGYTPAATYPLGDQPVVALQGSDDILVLSALTGQAVFRADARTGTRYMGPLAFVPGTSPRSSFIAVPTNRGDLALSPLTGEPLPSELLTRVPNARTWVSGDLVSILRQASILSAWTGPLGSDRTEPREKPGPSRRPVPAPRGPPAK